MINWTMVANMVANTNNRSAGLTGGWGEIYEHIKIYVCVCIKAVCMCMYRQNKTKPSAWIWHPTNCFEIPVVGFPHKNGVLYGDTWLCSNSPVRRM